MFRRVSIFGLAMALAWVTAAAGPPSNEEAMNPAQLARMSAARGAAAKGDDDKSPFPKFEDVTKDMESSKGLFTLWYYPPTAKDKDTEKLLAQIPNGLLGEKFMLSMSFSGGGFFTGFPLEGRVVKWELLPKQLVLVEPETLFVIDEKQTVSDVVRRTHPERIRAAVPIVTKSPQGDPLIDLGPLLKSNFADIGWMVQAFPGAAPGAASVNKALSKWTTKKTFELNVEVGVELAVARRSPPGSFDKKLIHYSFWRLPRTDYQPRVADDRVGYFLTTNRDWSKPTDSRDIFNRYINRWHLQKRDPSLPLCEPKQPIVFYIEKTVPVRFRRAVRDGILDWNKAFEKIGFLNAVEVRQQTEDNEWKDLDPEDMRYSFFRWIVSGAAFAMGPSRANPFTGEIYDADIIFDDSMVRAFEQQAARNISEALMKQKMNDPTLRAFLDKHPEWKLPTEEWTSLAVGEPDPSEALRDAIRERMLQQGYIGCDYHEGMKQQVALGYAVLADAGQEAKDRFLYEIIKEVVMHEVGHTLGLRHNFKASTIYSLEEIKRRRTAGEATVGSVMDYNPALFLKEDTLEGNFITPTIGPYDHWAIEYGYRPADGSFKPTTTEDEESDPDAEEKEAKVASDPAGDLIGRIPPDVLDKLPPEARKMLEQGAAAGAEDSASAPAQPPRGRKPGPSRAAGPSASELKMLKAIASRGSEPELAYATDEDTTALSPDPRSNRYDMGDDPIDWAAERIALIDKRLEDILDWAVKGEESWYHLRNTFVSLKFEKTRVLDHVGRYIGGMYTSRAHRGDPNAPPPFDPVPAELQRRALEFTAEKLYSDDFFAVSPEVLNHLAAHRWWHPGMMVDFVVDFPIHNFISTLQWWNLVDRLFPNTLRRIYDMELRTTDPDKVTAAEYLQRLQEGCWSDALDTDRIGKGGWSNTEPCISSVRRSLQRQYLNMMELLVRHRPGTVLSPELHAMVSYSLRNLEGRIQAALETKGLDFGSAAHLQASKTRIERMLAPELPELESRNGG